MANVTIAGNTYFVYATIDEANAYLLPSSYNEAWSVLTPDAKAGFLVESARILDRQKWKPEYDTQEKRLTVEGIVNGSILIAAMLASGNEEFVSNSTTASSTKRLKAGSAEIEYFKSFDASAATRFPLAVMELLGQYLGSTGSSLFARAGGSFVSGVNRRSTADCSWGYWTGI